MGCGASKTDADAPAPVTYEKTAAPPAAAPPPEPTPVPSAEPAAEAPAWVPPAGAVYHRLTKIPIKSGAMADIKKVTQSSAFKELVKTFEGVVGIEALSVDGETMLTHSRWESEEACNGGAAALGKVLKEHIGPYIAGPPEPPWVGPLAMDMSISGSGAVTAYRVVVMNLQPGKMQTLLDSANAKLSEFKAIDGLVSIMSFYAGPTSAVILAAYNSKDQLDAATPKIGAIMKEMGGLFAGPPTPFVTEVEWSTFDTAPAAAATAPAASAGPFAFASGLPDCCTASPDLYKAIAELPDVGRLVEMNFPPGAKDLPHEHPIHSMYFLVDCKLKISGPPTPTTLGEEGGVAEIPAGATPIFPAMAHQVENVGESTGKAIFVEPYPNCKPCGDIEGYISPFAASPGCYKILAEDDDWITGVLTMEVGEKDELHHHRDHLIYVAEGDGVTIYPGGDESSPMVVPLQVGAGIPAPMSAPPFAKHTLLNSGTVPLKMIFFEAKK